MPPKLLCVAEKPSVARTAASVLSKGSCTNETPRYPNANKIHRFKGKFRNQDVDIIFTSVLGHLYQLDFPDSYKNWSQVEPEELFHAKIIYKIPDKLQDIQRQLIDLSRQATYLQLWLDNDREGEKISEEVESVCKSSNPSLQVFRARFSALSSTDLWRALNNPTTINRNDSAAVTLREEIDLRTGAAFTRFQTLRYRNTVKIEKGVISYGSCQFPTLGFVVDAYEKRLKFIPEDFWYITVHLKKNASSVILKWSRNHLFCKLSTFALYASIMDNPTATVLSVNEQRVQMFKPFPLSTVELQKNVSLYLHINPHATMNIAEKLYSSGFISYPRTETDSFPDNFDYNSVINTLKTFRPVEGYATSFTFDTPRKGKHTDNAHPPIYPLKAFDGTGDEMKVYTYIARHFLACCSKDAVVMETNVMFDVGGEEFKLKGIRVLERNWYDVYQYKKLEGSEIPLFVKDEKLMPTMVKMEQSKTTAPQLLTEPQLISKMDKEGIGTDATIAEHIQLIQDRGYCKKDGEYFVPLPLGLALIDGYNSMGFDFAKPRLRAEMEKAMQRVSAGTESLDNMRKRFVDQYKDNYGIIQGMVARLDASFGRQFSKPGAREEQAAAITAAGRSGGTKKKEQKKDKSIGNRKKGKNDQT